MNSDTLIQTLVTVTVALGLLVGLGVYAFIVIPNRRERRTHEELFNEYRTRGRYGHRKV
jgi:hypothetical protein